MMHWGSLSGMGIGNFGFGWVLMILFWALVVLGIITFVKGLTDRNRMSSGQETAEQILKKRFAAGEISKDQFTDRMSLIREKH